MRLHFGLVAVAMLCGCSDEQTTRQTSSGPAPAPEAAPTITAPTVTAPTIVAPAVVVSAITDAVESDQRIEEAAPVEDIADTAVATSAAVAATTAPINSTGSTNSTGSAPPSSAAPAKPINSSAAAVIEKTMAAPQSQTVVAVVEPTPSAAQFEPRIDAVTQEKAAEPPAKVESVLKQPTVVSTPAIPAQAAPAPAVAVAVAPAFQPLAGGWENQSMKISGGWRITEQADGLYLELDDSFKTRRAPDLKLFLSPETARGVTADNATTASVLVSPLESPKGAQTYRLPSNIDLTKYRSLVLHCERYTKLWGAGDL